MVQGPATVMREAVVALYIGKIMLRVVKEALVQSIR
jgi:hypothetical protein